MSFIWEYCTNRETYFIPDALLPIISGRADMRELLIKVDLAEVFAGGLRIRGT